MLKNVGECVNTCGTVVVVVPVVVLVAAAKTLAAAATVADFDAFTASLNSLMVSNRTMTNLLMLALVGLVVSGVACDEN